MLCVRQARRRLGIYPFIVSDSSAFRSIVAKHPRPHYITVLLHDD